MSTTSSKKRSRSDNGDDSSAECPFTVTIDPDDRSFKKGKKRRRQDAAEEEEVIKLQNSPFAPTGKFKPDDLTLDCHYKVEPQDKWLGMTRYNSFVREYHSKLSQPETRLSETDRRTLSPHSESGQVLQRRLHLRDQRVVHHQQRCRLGLRAGRPTQEVR